MSNEKKLLIVTIILGMMLPISAFGLSLISDAFLFLGFYCGVSALFCGIILMDLKLGKMPKLIPIGFGMAFVGFTFLVASEFEHGFNILLSTTYGIAGLLTMVKGTKDRYDLKRNRDSKITKPTNVKLLFGIWMLISALCTIIMLFQLYPEWAAVSFIMEIVGFIFLDLGRRQSKRGMLNSPQTQNNTFICEKCGRELAIKYQHRNNICADCFTSSITVAPKKNSCHQPKIQGEVFATKPNNTFICEKCRRELTITYRYKGNICNACNAAIEQEIKNQNTFCSVCGVDLPIEIMHIIDDELFCHACFLKKYGTFDYYDDYEIDSTLEKAICSLRYKIITEITKNPSDKYQLASLLWQDASRCFPNSRFQWDGAWFNLDLKTGKLFVDVSTYPNQFGVSYEDSFSLSATEFNRISKQFNMSNDLQIFNSDEDWKKLFDDSLKSVLFSAFETLKKQDEA